MYLHCIVSTCHKENLSDFLFHQDVLDRVESQYKNFIHVKRGQNVATKFCQKNLYCDSTLKMQTEFFKKSLIIQIRKRQTTLPIRPVHAWLLIFKCSFLLENVLLSLLVDCNDCTVFCFESKSLL